jgi:hypothetical protein
MSHTPSISAGVALDDPPLCISNWNSGCTRRKPSAQRSSMLQTVDEPVARSTPLTSAVL